MTVLEKIKSFFRPSKPQAKAEEAKPAGAEGEAARASESKAGGGSDQKGATAA
ncbi:MAG: hypothetical protein HYX90_10280 [Chloroflexi bacterium]|nr:hypothetical protein [Chloroflexota bacterium]